MQSGSPWLDEIRFGTLWLVSIHDIKGAGDFMRPDVPGKQELLPVRIRVRLGVNIRTRVSVRSKG